MTLLDLSLGPIFSTLGLAVLAVRLGPPAWSVLRGQPKAKNRFLDSLSPDDLVSVIIPARNEELNLPILVRSLLDLDHRQVEIIIVDDHSTDRTGAVAEELAQRDARVRVLRSPPKPAGWVGKTWACLHGAHAARSDWLLFTDADTEHSRESLSVMLRLMKEERLDLTSALPFHAAATKFDPYMGPFHMLTFISSSAFSKPRAKRLFAIGQYLLFRKDFYFELGTHEATKMSFGEDMDLAEMCLARGGRYNLNRSGAIFNVRMYGSFTEFIAGWRRIFRVGFAHARLLVALEVFLVIACLTESFRFARATRYEVLLAMAGFLLVGIAQKKYGRFSWLGVLAAPLSLAVFIFVTVSALTDRLMGRDLRWRGRSYTIKA